VESCGGCPTGCASGCASAAPAAVAPPPAGEQIKPPKEGEPGKKLPEGGNPEAKPVAKPKEKEVRAPAILEVTPTVSNLNETGTKRPY